MRAPAFVKLARNTLLAELEYRSSYFILIFSTFITIAMELAVFDQIYGDRESVGGFSRDHAMPFILIGSFVRYGYQLWDKVAEFVTEIREGTFRRYLIQPIRFTAFFIARALGSKITTWVLMAIGLVVAKQMKGFEALLPAGTLGTFVVTWAMAVALVWQMYMMLVFTGFWIEEATFLAVGFNIGIGLFSGTMLPLTWLPESLATVLRNTPFPLMGDVPVRASLGLLPPEEFHHALATGAAWFVVLALINHGLQLAGYRRYEAYGG